MALHRILPVGLAFSLAWLCGCKQPLYQPRIIYPSNHITFQYQTQNLDVSLMQLAQNNPAELFRRGLANAENIEDMSGYLIRRECLGGNLTKEQEIAIKYLARPYAVQFSWLKNPGPAQRVLYVEGENNGNLLALPVLIGFLTGPVAKDPYGADAGKNSRRPITQFGFNISLARLLKPYETGELTVGGPFEDRFLGSAIVAGQQTLALERVRTGGNPVDDENSAVGWQVFLDVERLFPIGIIEYNRHQELLGYYVFKDMQYNTGLTVDDLKNAFRK